MDSSVQRASSKALTIKPRADLSFAISSGNPPFLLRGGICWDCFIADQDSFQCSHLGHDSELQAFVEASTHSRLRNVFKDVHALSCISNLAFQTSRKLSPQLYNEIVISVLYRLTHLNFDEDDLQESFRLGLLCFCSTVFMQRKYMAPSYDHLLNRFAGALDRLRRTLSKEPPVPIVFWLLILLAVVRGGDWSSLSHWHHIWLVEVIDRGNYNSWAQAEEVLRSIGWIGFAHNRPGEQSFDEARKTVIAL